MKGSDSGGLVGLKIHPNNARLVFKLMTCCPSCLEHGQNVPLDSVIKATNLHDYNLSKQMLAYLKVFNENSNVLFDNDSSSKLLLCELCVEFAIYIYIK